MQMLFSRDDHNHNQVIDEHTYNLPLLVPENMEKAPVVYINGYTGQFKQAPFSTDNSMHTNWVPFRLESNVNTPFGSDSNIYFQGVARPEVYNKYKDWLDVHNDEEENRFSRMDKRVYDACASSKGQNVPVCTMTCIDWWTNRPVPPQGSLTRDDGTGGGCPWGTVQGLSCYSCDTHNTYVRGAGHHQH
jgi:hypothetical protein